MPWSSWINAEIYDRFVRERGIYGWLNAHLVRLADVRLARRILDLGCGTGATTIACLRKMDAQAEIVGIDASEEMVGVARSNVFDPRARFEVVPAAAADEVDGTFDRVLCNAAFWQFPSFAPVFRALGERTAPGARFVFNVPAERVVGESSPIHPFQLTLVKQIEEETGSRFEGAPASVDPRGIAATGGEYGFGLVSTERHVYEGKQDELIELMSIPAMLRPLSPGLSEERQEAAWQRAKVRSDPDLEVTVPWIYFILERRS
jgi:SAM-dependent methyltransferase